MKRTILATLIIAILIIGIGMFLPHSFFSAELETPTPILASDVTTLATPTEPQDISISYENISFTIPVGVATGAEALAKPASDGPMNPSPAFVEFAISGYVFPDPNDSYHARIRVYPAVEYARINLWAAESLSRLQTTLVNSSDLASNDNLPNVPYMGSEAQLYASQVKKLSFQSGSGVRMISAYAQFPAPIGQYSSFYHYEGLTQDGKYYVVAEMPVTLPVYSDESNAGEFGITYTRKDWLYMQDYYQDVTGLINKASPEGFNPILGQLDKLVESIKINDTPAATTSNAPCLSPSAGLSLLSNAEDGYCVLYPSQYSSETRRFITINPAKAPGDVIGDAWVFIQVEDAAGITAEQAAEAQIAAAGPGFNIIRQSTIIDGEVAFIIDGLPGQDPNRQVFIVHKGRLYTLSFAPWQETQLIGGMGQRKPLEYLYTIVMQSFRFLPE